MGNALELTMGDSGDTLLSVLAGAYTSFLYSNRTRLRCGVDDGYKAFCMPSLFITIPAEYKEQTLRSYCSF
ncbi:hypothetical protein VCRA2127O15_430004 [Vibrio crassostreae]|nr:hypothetical protein VCRA2122O10_450007 [Vibrio crassostreae]CAK3010840.1 hypothetical protein VCRA2127O15_430004 [Vibrio crassostreae]